jgi:hypothetical protein
MTIYRSTSEPPHGRPPPGRRESGQEASPTSGIHPPRIQSPVGGAGHFDLPESDGTAEQHAADLPGFATPRRGPRGHPIPESYSSASMLHFCAASREPTSNPISPSPAPTTPIRRGRRSRADGPVHNSGGGAGSPDARERLVVTILHSYAVSQGACDPQADSMIVH